MNSKYALLTKWEVKIRLYIAQVNSFSFLFMDQHKVKVNDIKIQKKNLGQYWAIHLTSVWVNKAFSLWQKRQFFSPTWEIPRRQERSILPPQAANHFNMGFALSFYPQLQPYSDFLPRTPLGTFVVHEYCLLLHNPFFFTLNILIDQLSLIDFTVCGSERCFGSFGKKLRIMEDLSILCFVSSTSIGSKYYFLIFGRDAIPLRHIKN